MSGIRGSALAKMLETAGEEKGELTVKSAAM